MHGAYPVDQEELKRLGVDAICDPAGMLSTVVSSDTARSFPLTFWFWRKSLFRQFHLTSRTDDGSLSLIRPKLPLVHNRIEAPCCRNIVPKAPNVGLLLRTLG